MIPCMFAASGMPVARCLGFSAETHVCSEVLEVVFEVFRSKKRKMFCFVKIRSAGLQLLLLSSSSSLVAEGRSLQQILRPDLLLQAADKNSASVNPAALRAERGSESCSPRLHHPRSKTWKKHESSDRNLLFYSQIWTGVTVKWKLQVFYCGGGDVQLLTALHLLTWFMDLEQRAAPELRGFLIKHSDAGL